MSASPSRIAVVDYGVGNLRNVYKALEAAGAPAEIVDTPDGLTGAAGIVLPGVGAFGDAAANLRAAGFEAPLLAAIAAGTPLLGICVGMQLLFDESEEMGRHRGLGVIPGRVVRFAGDVPGDDGRPLKVPQIGWNQLHHRGDDPLLAGLPDGAYAYFVHSYYCAPAAPEHIVATTDFGIAYASVVRRGSVWGIQCHPEKSQAVGLRILSNFVGMVRGNGSTRINGWAKPIPEWNPHGRPSRSARPRRSRPWLSSRNQFRVSICLSGANRRFALIRCADLQIRTTDVIHHLPCDRSARGTRRPAAAGRSRGADHVQR